MHSTNGAGVLLGNPRLPRSWRLCCVITRQEVPLKHFAGLGPAVWGRSWCLIRLSANAFARVL